MEEKKPDRFIEKTKEKLEKSLDTIKESVAAKTGGVGNMQKKAPKNLKDLGQKKLVELAEEINKSLPYFEMAGFRLKHLEIELNISPKFIIHFYSDGPVPDMKKKEVLEQVKNRRIIKVILEALIKASHLQEYLKFGKLNFLGIAVHISAVPTVRILFGEPADVGE